MLAEGISEMLGMLKLEIQKFVASIVLSEMRSCLPTPVFISHFMSLRKLEATKRIKSQT
jgi:hypothetical protein